MSPLATFESTLKDKVQLELKSGSKFRSCGFSYVTNSLFVAQSGKCLSTSSPEVSSMFFFIVNSPVGVEKRYTCKPFISINITFYIRVLCYENI